MSKEENVTKMSQEAKHMSECLEKYLNKHYQGSWLINVPAIYKNIQNVRFTHLAC